MIKILVACANGAGSSLMMKIAVTKAVKAMDIEVDSIYHCSIDEAKKIMGDYDLVFIDEHFADVLEDYIGEGQKLIKLGNILSSDEVIANLKELGY